MDNNEFANYLLDLINKYNNINGELKLGLLNNNKFDYDIKNADKFKKFISSKYKCILSEHKMYYYYNMFLISKDENSHVYFKNNNLHMKYFTPIKNKYSLRFRNNDFNKIDSINFPTIDKYDLIENNKVESYNVKFKNSTISIQFININDKINSIVFKFSVDKQNIDNFRNNLSFILSKLYFSSVKI